MLTPLNTDTPKAQPPTAEDLRQREECENDFDEAITRARATGKWPAQVKVCRDGLTEANLNVVAEQYRGAGWRVDLHNLIQFGVNPRQVRALISKD
jgi:hypothetical protein